MSPLCLAGVEWRQGAPHLFRAVVSGRFQAEETFRSPGLAVMPGWGRLVGFGYQEGSDCRSATPATNMNVPLFRCSPFSPATNINFPYPVLERPLSRSH